MQVGEERPFTRGCMSEGGGDSGQLSGGEIFNIELDR